MSSNCLNKEIRAAIIIEPRHALGSNSSKGEIQSKTASIMPLAITVTSWVRPPLLSKTTVLARAPQLTNDIKNEQTILEAPRANNSLFESILYLCFREYKSATDMLEANATIAIITASLITLVKRENSGRDGFANLKYFIYSRLIRV